MTEAAQKIAVVGCGYWGRNLVRNFARLGALHSICDSERTVLAKLAADYPEAQTEIDYQAVLGNDAIGGVVIAAPAALHYLLAREALQHGKDVFVEKPLSLEVEEGQELVELARSNDRILMVGHLLEYHPAVARLKQLIDTGELGRIRYVYSNRLNLGKFRTEENILWSFAPHDISAILLLLGSEMPHEVSAHGGYYLHQDIADVTLTTMSFRNGVKAHIFVSWLHPFKEQRLVVVGERKMAEFNDTRQTDKLLLYPHDIEWIDRVPVPRPGQAEAVGIPDEEPLAAECRDFIDCIATRGTPRVDGSKGLQVLQVLSSCQRSLERGGVVVPVNRGQQPFFVHHTSIVESPCRIGEGTKIWHSCHIMPDAAIGRNCVIGQNVFIGKGVQTGGNVKIENNVSVFEGVTLEDDVFCGPSCVFTNVINPRSRVSRKHEFRPTVVKKGATIGANATIVCGSTVGRYAMIGAGSVVTSDVPDHALAYGNPARCRAWVCECGEKLQLAEKNRATCAACGAEYRMKPARSGGGLRRIEA